ncbi:MAG: LCP family protein [Sporolactobacillus sp.]
MVNEKSPSRSNFRKSRKKHRVLRYVLLSLLVIILAAAVALFYKWHQLNPENHFNHLSTIGGTTNKDYKQKAGTFNVLLIGSDARPGDTASHTDSMVLVHADLKKHTYNMLSIPRDTRVYMDGYGYTKLTSVQYVAQSAHGTKAGIIEAVKAISRLTNVPINYYAETNYWGLQYMVDAIGGIDMNLPFQVRLTHAWHARNQGKVFAAGMHHFDGEMVSEVTHERYSLPGTDYGRQQLQEAALIGIAKKMMQPSNVTRFPALSKSLSKFLVATNMTTDDMVSIGLGIKGDFHPEDQIKYRQVKGTDKTMYDDVLKANNDQIILAPDQLQSVIKNYFTN